MNKEESALDAFAEFRAVFWTYVRTDPETGLVDKREQTAQRLASLLIDQPTNDQLLEAHDCAAIFSGCIGIAFPESVALIAKVNGTKLGRMLQVLQRQGRLPLMAATHHPAEKLLTALVEKKHGWRLYRQVAVLLLQAQTEPGMRVHLFNPTGTRPVSEAESTFADFEAAEVSITENDFDQEEQE